VEKIRRLSDAYLIRAARQRPRRQHRRAGPDDRRQLFPAGGRGATSGRQRAKKPTRHAAKTDNIEAWASRYQGSTTVLDEGIDTQVIYPTLFRLSSEFKPRAHKRALLLL
jgi:hypothetical protein